MADTTPAADKLLRAYDDAFLECRRGNLGHVWRTLGFWREPEGVVARGLICDRCETTRTDRWDAKTYERFTPRYHYADGYRIMTGEGAHTPEPAAVRREAVRRAKVYANEQSMFDSLTKGNHRR